MKKILITGGTGLLGKALVEESHYNILATYVGDYVVPDSDRIKYHKLDILDRDGYERAYEAYRPDVTVHAASIGSPDYAEKNKKYTWDINVLGTQMIISCCEKYGSKLIYISSNGIYDGEHAPYKEDDAARPVNYYGETKLAGEKVTRAAPIVSAIVRPILMYGWHYPFERSNIVTMSLAKLRKGEMVYAYDDVYSNALYANSCAEAIVRIIEDDKYETFNLAGAQRSSIYGLLVAAAEVFGLDKTKVKPVKQGYFNELVPRPKDTSYVTDKMNKVLGLKPLSLKEGLQMMKERGK
jgi:dTDP-4-dehydrorhamnose reductase